MDEEPAQDRHGGELIDRLIAYLDDPEDQTRVWKGLRFMEANGLDFALRYEELHGYLTDERNSPIENAKHLTHEEEREIVLALRDAVRRDLGLPPLTEEEERAWEYRRREPVRWRPDQMQAVKGNQRYRTTPAERAQMRGVISSKEPEILRAMTLFAAHEVGLGDRYNEALSTLWLMPRLNSLIAEARPDLGAMDVHQFVFDLLEEFWREAGAAAPRFTRLDDEKGSA